ncbi:hypothetical protein IR114_07360, partial [Granulicatella sp. 19428wC4_WM01]|nr:hypothetical protein [Granulicatella sp. 19428wC4_WM01]
MKNLVKHVVMLASLIMICFPWTSGHAQENASVVFQAQDGTIKRPDENKIFHLSSLDVGKFILEDADTFELSKQGAHFQSYVDRKSGIYRWRDVWVMADGTYNPHDVREVLASVYDKNPLLYRDALKLSTFTINNVSSQIEELKLFVDDKEISEDNPALVDASNPKKVIVKGRKSGETEFIDIPSQALKFVAPDSGTYIGSDGTFVLQNVEQATFRVEMRDQTARKSFVASKQNVLAKEIDVVVPNPVYIEHWNALSGTKYIGINSKRLNMQRAENEYEVVFTPSNTSNQNVTWTALTPEIAEFEELHGNGIVPKKAGIARFIVASKGQPEIKKEVAIRFEYKAPLQKVELAQREYTVKPYETIDLQIDATPSEATDQRFIWTYSQPNIVEVKSNISRANLNVPHRTTHQLVGKNVGTVTVTGTPVDTTNGISPITFTVTVTKDTQTDSKKVAVPTDSIKHGTDYLVGQSQVKYGDEWVIFTLARTNPELLKQESLEQYFASVVDTFSENKRLKTTDIARVVLALGAIGKDSTKVGEANLIEKLYNNSRLSKETSNAIAFTLIALDSKGYAISEQSVWNKETLVAELLKFQKEDGSFSLAKTQKVGSVDMTAMSLQALAPYYDKNAPEDNAVKQAVNKGLMYLQQQMNDQAGYGENNVGNSASTAQVLTALTALGINPVSEEYTRGSNNMVDYLRAFQRESGYATFSNGQSDIFGGTQVTYSLNAYDRFVNTKPRLYDFSDEKKDLDVPKENKEQPKEDAKPAVPENPEQPKEDAKPVTPEVPEQPKEDVKPTEEATREEMEELYDLLDKFEQGVQFPQDKESVKRARDIYNRLSELDREDLSQSSTDVLLETERQLAEYDSATADKPKEEVKPAVPENPEQPEEDTKPVTPEVPEQPKEDAKPASPEVSEQQKEDVKPTEEATREEMEELYDLLDKFEQGVQFPQDKESVKRAR